MTGPKSPNSWQYRGLNAKNPGLDHLSNGLIELVKNSYDADASVVLIRFHGPLEEGKGRI